MNPLCSAIHACACLFLTRFTQFAVLGRSLQAREFCCNTHDRRKHSGRVRARLDGEQWVANVDGAHADGEQETSSRRSNISRTGVRGLGLK
jgi:hypothetical protein